jgi:hypothetical protein
MKMKVKQGKAGNSLPRRGSRAKLLVARSEALVYNVSEESLSLLIIFRCCQVKVGGKSWNIVVGLRPLGCWGPGFESRSGHGCLSVVFICYVVLCR